MERYERLALIFDTAESVLGVAALHLIQHGLDPLYARAPDDVLRLARERRDRIAALVVPGALPLATLDAVLAPVARELPGERAAVVAVAPPRQRAHLAALRERGIRWAVFAPYEPGELRFAVAAALATGDALEPRRGLRVPICLPAAVRHDRATRKGDLTNLSLGGAFVALPDPPGPGAALSLEFPIGERLLHLQAQVVHRREPRRFGAAGIGVAFSAPTPLESHLLEGFVRERVDSFRL